MSGTGGITTAQLGFMAIYNPSLGKDDTIDDQIVYYASVKSQSQRRRHRSRGKPTDHLSQAERHERLRQIGLAQGMVEFSKGFSGGVAVDSIDTEKTRVIVHRLEPGWWILTSIDLTKIALPPKLATSKASEPADENVEYTSKEIKPSALILQDLLRAHSTFLLHHGTSLSDLFVRSKRSKFISLLSRFWDLFLSTWNVMLHGSPIRNIFGGINMAASGELGFGVGEEERGSGEREVLEGLVGRIDGLVDLVVSKFTGGEDMSEGKTVNDTSKGDQQLWLGTGQEPDSEDGAIFLGVGALSRKSLRDVTQWTEDLYTWGENAYGVVESPTSIRQARRAKKAGTAAREDAQQSPRKTAEGRPPADPKRAGVGPAQASASAADESAEQNEGHMDKFVNYLKLGYGTYWSLGKSGEDGPVDEEATPSDTRPRKHERPSDNMQRSTSQVDDTVGHFLIGLKGEVEETGSDRTDHGDSDDNADQEHNSRTMVRTVHIELESEGQGRQEVDIVKNLGTPFNEDPPADGLQVTASAFDHHDSNKAKKLRVVVYVNKPFIFTFLFELRTDSLAFDTQYRSLHYQLAPLRKPLLASTAFRLGRPDAGKMAASIYDLIWDPKLLTVHSTIPNIPEPGPGPAAKHWSRAEAMNTYMQLLTIFDTTRSDVSELERTCKTNRGWWVVWTRIVERAALSRHGSDDSEELDQFEGDASDATGAQSTTSHGSVTPANPVPRVERTVSKEIFLIRRASDHAGFRGVSGSYGETGNSWADGPGRLAQGIGVDTRKYIEGLLSLSH